MPQLAILVLVVLVGTLVIDFAIVAARRHHRSRLVQRRLEEIATEDRRIEGSL
jgi:hypothetical protein